MPATSKKGLDGADAPRPLDDEDEVDDEDDELMDGDDDEDSLVGGVDVAPAPPPTSNPTPPPSQAATLDHHHPIPVPVAVAVDEEEDLPSSSSSSSAEEDDDAPSDLLPPPPPAAAAAAAAAAANNNNPNPNPNPGPSSSTAIVALPAPLNGSSQSLDLDIIPASADPFSSNYTPSPKRLRTSSDDPKPTPPPSDDSRRLFQRLWTDDDEIELLQGFLEFTSERSALPNHHHHDTTPFYDRIKTRLQVDFNKNQLVEKLRRLKKKYRNALKRISSSKDFAFKSPHEQATFEISRKIWSTAAAEATLDDNDDASNHPLFHNGGGTAFQFDRGSSRSSSRNKRSRSRSTNSVDGLLTAPLGGDHPPPSVVVAGYLPPPPPPPPPPHHHPVLAPPTSSSTPLPSLIEDTVRSCLSPLFKELLHCAVTNSASSGFVGIGMPVNHLPQLSSWSVGGVGGGNSEGGDDRWRKQQILELEVYSKRLELVQEQIKLALEGLKSKGG